MFTFLLVVQAIIAACLVAVILMQRSEGGGLGMGGSPSGLMSARGAADFLTRATAVLATLFVVMSIALAAYASVSRAPSTIDTSLARPAAQPIAPAGSNPLGAIPGLGGAPSAPAAGVALPGAIAPASAPSSSASDRSSASDASDSGSSSKRSSRSSDESSDGKRERSGTSASSDEKTGTGSPKTGTTPTADARPERRKVASAPASSSLDIVPLRQEPKVGTLAPAPSPTPPAATPAPAAAAPAAAASGNSAGQ